MFLTLYSTFVVRGEFKLSNLGEVRMDEDIQFGMSLTGFKTQQVWEDYLLLGWFSKSIN